MCCLTGWKVKPKIFFSVKKNTWPQFLKNQKSLLYNLSQISIWTTCISGIFDFCQIEDVHFFYISFFVWNLPPVVNFLYTFFMKCENFVLFHDFLYSPLNLGPEKCNCMQIHHSLKLVINAYFCPKTMLGDLKPVLCIFCIFAFCIFAILQLCIWNSTKRSR